MVHRIHRIPRHSVNCPGESAAERGPPHAAVVWSAVVDAPRRMEGRARAPPVVRGGHGRRAMRGWDGHVEAFHLERSHPRCDLVHRRVEPVGSPKLECRAPAEVLRQRLAEITSTLGSPGVHRRVAEVVARAFAVSIPR